jgi:hypothetical protein
MGIAGHGNHHHAAADSGDSQSKGPSMLKLKENQVTKSPWCSASREELCAAVQCLRDNFITYVGPFVIKSGVAAFKVSNYVLTADELVSLHKSGHLTKEGLSNFAKALEAAEENLGLKRHS